MGIRDQSYYGWSDILVYRPSDVSGSLISMTSSFFGVAVDSSGNIFAAGKARISSSITNGLTRRWFTLRSQDNGNTWKEVFLSKSNDFTFVSSLLIDRRDTIFVAGSELSSSSPSSVIFIIRSSSDHGDSWGQQVFSNMPNNLTTAPPHKPLGAAVDSNNTIYLSSFSGVFSSSDNGLTWGHQNILQASASNEGTSLVVDTNNVVYWCVSDHTLASSKLVFAKSINGGATWTSMSIGATSTNLTDFKSVGIDKLNNLYFYSTQEGIFSSSNGTNWAVEASISRGINNQWQIKSDNNNNIYLFGNTQALSTKDEVIVKNGFSASQTYLIDALTNYQYLNGYIDNRNTIYVVGSKLSDSVIRRGKLTANSASLGPRMLSPTFAYTKTEIDDPTIWGVLSSSLTVKESVFKLNNISEFPHFEGLYQMKNIILGTQTSGRVGKTNDSLIQVNHIGSFVKVLWPRQDQDIFVKGFGDFTPGQKPGKLTTDWQPGDFIDVSKDKFDHLALYGYGLKNISGTLDSILIRIERRPLRSVGFTVEKAIENTVSGSYVESVYRDLLHRLDVDYGDLTIKEITWPIDIDLENVKELRISAKFKNGQADDKNSSLVVYGRFIKSDKNHEET